MPTPILKPTKLRITSPTLSTGTQAVITVTTVDGMGRALPVDHDVTLVADQGGGHVMFAAYPGAKPTSTAQFVLPKGQTQTTFTAVASDPGSWTMRVSAKVGGLEAQMVKLTATPSPAPVSSGGTTTNTPPIPTGATAAGFTKLVFYDDFTSATTISDGSKDAKWYLSSPVDPGASLKMSDISVADSCLTILTDKSGYSAGLFTYTSDSRSSFTFNGGYFEARMRWSPTGHQKDSAWPAFWLYDLAGIKNPSGNFAELDILEEYPKDGAATPPGQPNTLITTVHEWSGNASQVGNYDGNVPKLPAGFDTSVFHSYGAAWTGSKVIWYIDGLAYTSANVGAGTKFPSMAAAQMVMLLGTGRGWPLVVDSVQVWGS